MLIHLGDRVYDIFQFYEELDKYIFIRGNMEIEFPEISFYSSYDKIFDIENVRILATHGHRYSVHSTLIFLKKEAKKIQAKLVLFGHTHQKELLVEDDIMYFNPGALQSNDYGIITIEKNEIVDIEQGYLSDKW